MEKFSFFDSIADDRLYYAEDFALHMKKYFTNGVFNNGLQVVSNNNMTVTVKSGDACIEGYRYSNTTDKALTIDNADGTLKRIDNIVIRLDLTNRNISALVIKGSNSASPVAPTLVRTSTIYDIRIAKINVNNGVVSITGANIEDTRFITPDCGNVIQAVQTLDFTGAYQQLEQYFYNWFNDTKEVFNEDTIGYLVEQLDIALQKQGTSVPVGGVIVWTGSESTIPVDYMHAKGQSLNKDEYPRLFNVIGYTYGGSGQNFNLPDYRNRVVADLGDDTNFNVIGKKSGASTHKLTVLEMPQHTHIQDAHTHKQDAHTHSISSYDASYASVTAVRNMYSNKAANPQSLDGMYGAGSTTATNQNTTATNQNTGGDGNHNNVQPTITQIYIIKVLENAYIEDVRNLDIEMNKLKKDVLDFYNIAMKYSGLFVGNANDLEDFRIYHCSSTNVTNLPTTTGYYIVECFNISGTKLQRATNTSINASGNYTYTRRLQSGTWTTWYTV